MRNQFFGDVPDLNKHDLLMHLAVSFSHSILYVAMLNKNNGNSHGKNFNYSKSKAGVKNQRLISFLEDCINGDNNLSRDINHLTKFYNQSNLAIDIYQNGFDKSSRINYFQGVAPFLSNDRIILLDPDNGMESVHSNRKHLNYFELKFVYDSMTNDSIILIYQTFSRKKRYETIEEINRLINISLLVNPIIIKGYNNFFFIVITKKLNNQRKLLKSILPNYIGSGNKLDIL